MLAESGVATPDDIILPTPLTAYARLWVFPAARGYSAALEAAAEAQPPSSSLPAATNAHLRDAHGRLDETRGGSRPRIAPPDGHEARATHALQLSFLAAQRSPATSASVGVFESGNRGNVEDGALGNTRLPCVLATLCSRHGKSAVTRAACFRELEHAREPSIAQEDAPWNPGVGWRPNVKVEDGILPHGKATAGAPIKAAYCGFKKLDSDKLVNLERGSLQCAASVSALQPSSCVRARNPYRVRGYRSVPPNAPPEYRLRGSALVCASPLATVHFRGPCARSALCRRAVVAVVRARCAPGSESTRDSTSSTK
ncbi:hypothetical protein B0H15DRAFT_955128 [Mycena belliarum]|uniref:Uncharacterized protein n=1 Tax=Mycena belliarum TaxID=1033014 RepID=A0AAD6TTA7_9AGAR|nr:hypothetical protein B0H15DRAFT_955128 [Mycena belliae]